jgi:hypothetical protein
MPEPKFIPFIPFIPFMPMKSVVGYGVGYPFAKSGHENLFA